MTGRAGRGLPGAPGFGRWGGLPRTPPVAGDRVVLALNEIGRGPREHERPVAARRYHVGGRVVGRAALRKGSRPRRPFGLLLPGWQRRIDLEDPGIRTELRRVGHRDGRIVVKAQPIVLVATADVHVAPHARGGVVDVGGLVQVRPTEGTARCLRGDRLSHRLRHVAIGKQDRVVDLNVWSHVDVTNPTQVRRADGNSPRRQDGLGDLHRHRVAAGRLADARLGDSCVVVEARRRGSYLPEGHADLGVRARGDIDREVVGVFIWVPASVLPQVSRAARSPHACEHLDLVGRRGRGRGRFFPRGSRS